MSTIRLPAGRSIRELAEDLGLAPEELARHANIRDVEAPLSVEQVVQLPDGFMRQRDRNRRTTMAAVPVTESLGGLNAAMAANMEHLRTQLAGGLRHHPPTEDEKNACAEARRAFLRFEPESHQLAIDLYRPLTQSKSAEVRGEAFAGRAVALAQTHLLFGAPAESVRLASLSEGKAAVMATPKSPWARLGMALALQVGDAADLVQSQRELELGLRADQKDPWLWAEYAHLLSAANDPETDEALAIALELDSGCLRALEVASLLARKAQDWPRAEELLRELIRQHPNYANARARLAALLRGRGQDEAATDMLQAALALATDDHHRRHIGVLGGHETP